MGIHEKLLQVQSKLKAPKNQYNSFGKYNYRSCEDILEGLKPLLAEIKATLTINDEIVQIGERFYVKAIVSFIDTESNEAIEVSAYAREDERQKGMDAMQLTGATSSYARKYALNGLFAIDDTKDSDTPTEEQPNKKPQQTKPQTKQQSQQQPTKAKTLNCSDCGAVITQAVHNYCKKNVEIYKGKSVCQKCQPKYK